MQTKSRAIIGLTCGPARDEREAGAFFPFSFSAALADVALAPFPAISAAPLPRATAKP